MRRDSIVALSGWVFADLMLGLVVIFMGLSATVVAVSPRLLPPTISVTPRCDGKTAVLELVLNPVSTATAYDLYRDGLKEGPVDPGTTDIGGLYVAGRPYKFSVTARNAAATSDYSNTVTAVAPPCGDGPLGPPSIGLTPRCDGDTQVFDLRVTAVPGATGYDLYRGSVVERSVRAAEVETIRGNVAGSTYAFRVRAKNAALPGEFSPTVTLTAIACSPTVRASTLSVCRVLAATDSVQTLTPVEREDLLYGRLRDLNVPGLQVALALTFGYQKDVGDGVRASAEGVRLASMVNEVLTGESLRNRFRAPDRSLLEKFDGTRSEVERASARTNWEGRGRYPNGTVAIELFLSYDGDTRSFGSDGGCVRD